VEQNGIKPRTLWTKAIPAFIDIWSKIDEFDEGCAKFLGKITQTQTAPIRWAGEDSANGSAENVGGTGIQAQGQFHIAQLITRAGFGGFDDIGVAAGFIRVIGPFTVLEVFPRTSMPEKTFNGLLMDRAIKYFG